MVKKIKVVEEALSSRELVQIIRIEHDVLSVRDIHFMDSVPHIECDISGDVPKIEIQPMWANPYVLGINGGPGSISVKLGRASYGELFEKRKETLDILVGSGRNGNLSVSDRGELFKVEFGFRRKDLDVHKFYLSESAGFDVGIVIASAHWLRTVGSDFYADSEEHYRRLGVSFKWEGMERTVGLTAKDKSRNPIMYAVGCSVDFYREENLAQLFGGCFDAGDRICELTRERLKVLHDSRYLCVLDNPDCSKD